MSARCAPGRQTRRVIPRAPTPRAQSTCLAALGSRARGGHDRCLFTRDYPGAAHTLLPPIARSAAR